ncbi:MAG: penicillin-binding protein 2 [Actinomycetes bacterium]
MSTTARRHEQSRRRLFILLIGLVILFGLIVIQVAKLQVFDPGHYLRVGASQTVRSQVLAADRGTIYDRNHTELAMSVPLKSVFADPKLIANPIEDAAKLAPILGLDAGDLALKLGAPNRFTYLARKVTKDVSDAVAGLKLVGIEFLDETVRDTPGADTTRSLIGSVDLDNNALSGLERQYADQLTGTPGSLTLERNPQGHTIPVGDHQLTPAVKGDDLVLTVDRSMQFETERVLSEQVKAAGGKGGIAIVTKPATGEVLAMVNVTTDPTTGEVKPSGNNAAVTTVYEPGSVMKIVTIAAALEKGQVTPDTTFSVPDHFQVGDHLFSDAEPHATESMTVAKILAESSNIGTIKIGEQLGKQGIYDSLKNLGFGARTSLDFLNEANGNVLAPSKWSATSIGTIPIGQGVSATPLQVLEAYNTIANHGLYVGPRLVDSTIDSNGNEHPMPADATRRALSTETADKVNLMLRGVVTGGTGLLAAVDGYTVAGKTGTARKVQPGGSYYDAGGVIRYESTFVGMVPAEAPALSVIVIIDEPTAGSYFGGAVAAPAFSKIASFGLQRFSVPPPVTDGAAGGIAMPGATASSATDPQVGTIQRLPNGKLRAMPAGMPVAPPVSVTVTTRPPISASKRAVSSPTTTRKP